MGPDESGARPEDAERRSGSLRKRWSADMEGQIMRKMTTMAVLALVLGLLWAGTAAGNGVQVASAAPPAPAGDQYYPQYYPMMPYGGAYPMPSYGSVQPYSGMPYGGAMSYAGYSSGYPSGYPYAGGSMTAQAGAPSHFGITVSVAPTSSAAAGASAVRIANFAFNPPTMTVSVGQTVTWTNGDTVAHTTTSDTNVWNSGVLQPGASFSQTFNTPGTYAYHCMIHPTMMGTITVVGSTAATTTAPASAAFASTALSQNAGPSVTYAAGWNLVGGPAGTTLMGANGPLYAFRAGDTSYETVSAGSPLTAGVGYWAYFNTAVTETLPMNMGQPSAMPLPAGQFVLIGNPNSVPMIVTGADTVLTYDAVHGYQAATMLQPGQGAWAFSNNGGSLTMRSSGNAAGPAAGT